MKTPLPDKDHEAARQQAHVDLLKAERVVKLWEQFSIANSDIPVALQIPETQWEVQKAAADCPPLFTLGRRLFVLTSDLQQWMINKAKAEARPGTRKNRKHQLAREQVDQVAASGRRS